MWLQWNKPTYTTSTSTSTATAATIASAQL
jgi:hypothetical protein